MPFLSKIFSFFHNPFHGHASIFFYIFCKPALTLYDTEMNQPLLFSVYSIGQAIYTQSIMMPINIYLGYLVHSISVQSCPKLEVWSQ